MRLPIAAVAMLLLAACPAVEGDVGPQGPEGPPGYSPLASGTRIKARVGVTSDGAKLFLGWFDAEIGVDCEFLQASDGKTRCLPGGPRILATAYEDSACTRMIVAPELELVEPAPAHAIKVVSQGMHWGKSVLSRSAFSVGEQFTGDSGYSMSEAGCSAEPWTLSSYGQYRWFRAERIPDEASQELANSVE